MTFREIAEQLQAAAEALDDMAGLCCCPAGSQFRGDIHDRTCPMRQPTVEHHWAEHFRSDAKSMKLLGQARDVAVSA